MSCATGSSVNSTPSISQGTLGKIASLLGDMNKFSAQLAVLQISVKFVALTFAGFTMLTLISFFGRSGNNSGLNAPRSTIPAVSILKQRYGKGEMLLQPATVCKTSCCAKRADVLRKSQIHPLCCSGRNGQVALPGVPRQSAPSSEPVT